MRVEFTDEQRRGRVFAGVDTHSRTHWLCVLGEYGNVRLSQEFPATAEGYDALAAAIGAPEGCVAVGVEGTASYGAGLTRRLRELGFQVYEVLRPKRAKRRRGQAKSDAADAERAARDAMAGAGLSIPKAQDGWVEELRLLKDARDCLAKSCTALSNTARCLVGTADEGVRAALSGLSAFALMSRLAEPGPGVGEALSALGRAWVSGHADIRLLEREMRALIEANCPSMLAVFGCGPVCAARLIVAAGDNPERIGGESQLAALFGTSPVEASSGETKRHRLNRGGNRDANRALHAIAVTRLATDPRTQAYVERRCGGPGPGRKSKKEAIRCLQRYIVREVYRAIMHPFDVPEDRRPAELAEARSAGAELRAARVSAGLRLADVAGALGVGVDALSRLETGVRPSKSLAKRYAEWIEDGMPVDIEEQPG